ncbi:MAG TPA: respiratory nitrate reductase subunit gamma [Polyangia bacterium]|jgi:nitrate reductase gamma subunit
MILYLVPLAAVVVFVVAVAARLVRLASLPVHLRWELYPVAHEPSAHGGSFLEHLDWWTRRRPRSRLGELKVMVPEILLLKGVREHNPTLWWRSYPFHLGLYLGAAFFVLLVAGAIMQATGRPITAGAGAVGAALYWLTAVAGIAGLALALIGALGLLFRRLGDPALREYSSAGDLLNLVFFVATAAVGLLAVTLADHDFAQTRGFAQRVLTLQLAGDVPGLCAAAIVMSCALFAYIPTTHMAHFFTKWFMYHGVRWDDEVNEVGSALEERLQRQLGWRVDWNAPHIRGDRQKTWVDVATEEVAKK